MLGFVRRCARSVFIRLALVMVLAAVALNVVTYRLFLSYQHDTGTSLNRNIVEYAGFLMRELGSPPDRVKAELLSQRLNMRITLEGPAGGEDGWSAGRDTPFPVDHLRPWFATDTVQASTLHGYHRIRVAVEPGRFVTFDIYPTAEEQAGLRRIGFYFLACTCLILLGTYGVIRYLLRHVRRLAEGAAAVRDGDLAARVPEKSGGELADLSRTFNEMVARLEEVVRTQKGLLLAVSHELRTPITRLKLQMEMLEDMPDTAPTRAAMFGEMRQDLREMQAMVNSLLEAARMQHDARTLARADTDLNGLAKATARRFEDQAPGVVVRLPVGPTMAYVDPDRVGTLLRNLLDNATKYSSPGAKPVEFQLSKHGGHAEFTVRDHGMGVPADAVSRLFDPFFRVDESRTRESGGYGLGLSLCRAIAKAHGGTITAEPAPEWEPGLVVTVRLPLRKDNGAS